LHFSYFLQQRAGEIPLVSIDAYGWTMHMDGLVVHFGSTHAQKKVLGRREKKEKEKKKDNPFVSS
jgi:hypothetical protein